MASTSLGRLYVDLLMKTGGFETDAGRAAKIAEKRAREIDRAFSQGMRSAGKSIAGFGVALIGISSAAEIAMAGVRSFFGAINNADKIAELSTRLGISTETMSALGYAAGQTGSDLDQLGSAIPKLSKQIAEAADSSSEAGKLFAALGIDVKDANGNLRDVEDVLPEVSDLFKTLKNDTLEQTLAMRLFGKSGAEMLEFLNLGSDGLAEMSDKAAGLGIIISGETAAAADKFNDQLADLQAAGNGLATQLAAGLLPAMTELTEGVTEFVADGSNAALVADGISIAFETMSNSAALTAFAIRSVGEAAVSAAGEMGLLLESLILTNEEQEKGRRDALASIESLSAAKGPDFSNVRTSASSLQGRELQLAQVRALRQRDAEDRLLGLFSEGSGGRGGGAKKPKGEKSDADKAAERLAAAYDSLIARQNESISLFGKEGEAAQVRYDIEFGALKGLEDAKASALIANAEKLDQMEMEAELQKLLDDKAKDQIDRFDGVLTGLQDEAAAYHMTNIELRTRNALKEAGVALDSEQGMAIALAVQQADKLERLADVMDNARGIAYDFLIDLPNGAADAWKNALASIESMLLQWAAKGIIEQVFGQAGTTGKGSMFGDMIGGLFGGGEGGEGSGGGFNWGGLFASFFGGGRADGGPVMGGKMYEVNERGMPELLNIGSKQLLMMPAGQGGRVTPMRSGGGTTQVNNFHFAAPTDSRTQQQIAAKTDFQLRRASARNS